MTRSRPLIMNVPLSVIKRQIAEIDLGLDHFPIAPAKPHDRLDGRFERHVAVAALLDRIFRLA